MRKLLTACVSMLGRHRLAYSDSDVQSKVFVWIRVFVLLVAAYLFIRVPPVGVGVGILAVVAASMSLHEHQNIGDKASWMFLVVLLLGVETRSIIHANRVEDERFAHQTASQNAEYLALKDKQDKTSIATMGGINQSIRQNQLQFQKTIGLTNSLLKKSDDLLKRSTDNLNATTGGDSFSHVYIADPGVPPYIYEHGKFPLHDLRIQFLFIDKKKGYWSPMMEYRLGALGVDQSLQLLALHFGLPDSAHWTVMIYFDALNGHWSEQMEMVKIGKEWHESFRVILPLENGASYKTLFSIDDAQAPFE